MNDILRGLVIMQGITRLQSDLLKSKINNSYLSSMFWFLDKYQAAFENDEQIKYEMIKMDMNNKKDSWKFRSLDSATINEGFRELNESINKLEIYFKQMIKKYPEEFKQAFPEGM